ncbi:tetratricopeptide repeat protein [Deinococcus planocerae]|uniref:tetratricopeptide repeat protein n=1 Tax=Deinococcus planocerae TaxID=1737569 RepID=UPI001FEBFF85|nr:tetratricopeptide repeat protein [Deinococcus planocerae]
MPRPPAAFVSDEELALSVPALVEGGRADLALRTLWLAADGAPDLDRFARLLDLLALLPPQTRSSGPGVRLHLRLLTGLRRAGDSLDAVEAARDAGLGAHFLNVYRAWALSQQERFGEALETLKPALSESLDTEPDAGPETGGLTRFEDTLGWRVRARSLAALGQGGWREGYARARLHATGRALALVWLEEGATLSGRGDVQGALRAYTQALPLVERDPYYHALALHNLGLVCLRDCRFGEAEAYFGRVSGVGRAAAFRARALCGEGAVRRALGEWDRAAWAYRAALELQAEDDDRQQAWRGLGHTLRLSGRARSAVEWLTRATTATPGDRQTGRSWVFVDVAAAYAALGDVSAAHEALGLIPPLTGEDADRERIVRAELARQGGDLAGALSHLGGLNLQTLWAREEAHAFPELFSPLPDPATRPAPLPRAERTHVTVRALGPLDVRVNGRPVPVGPASRAGVLLVALLEAGGRAGTGELALAVSSREDRCERHGKQAVSRIAGELRRALGWEGSVQARSGAYFLDPAAEWDYDVRSALEAGQPIEAFLSGVTLPWVLDRETQLRQKDSDHLH